jgi:hypothetical protein
MSFWRYPHTSTNLLILKAPGSSTRVTPITVLQPAYWGRLSERSGLTFWDALGTREVMPFCVRLLTEQGGSPGARSVLPPTGMWSRLTSRGQTCKSPPTWATLARWAGLTVFG